MTTRLPTQPSPAFDGATRLLFIVTLLTLLARAVTASHSFCMALEDARPLMTDWDWSLRWHASPIVAAALSCLVWRWRPRPCLRSELAPQSGAGYRSPPAVVVRADRAACRRASALYLVRLLPVLLLFAWGAPPFAPIFTKIEGCGFCRGFIAPVEYLLLTVEWTAVILFHLPTRRRIVGQPIGVAPNVGASQA